VIILQYFENSARMDHTWKNAEHIFACNSALR